MTTAINKLTPLKVRIVPQVGSSDRGRVSEGPLLTTSHKQLHQLLDSQQLRTDCIEQRGHAAPVTTQDQADLQTLLVLDVSKSIPVQYITTKNLINKENLNCKVA